MSKPWTREAITELVRSYQPACVIAAAADLDLFRALGDRPVTASVAARRLEADLRGTTILLDALAALGLIEKNADQFSVPAAVAAALGQTGPGSVLATAQHQANCLRRWTTLARVVRAGVRAEGVPSIRGSAADYESFILAMNEIAASAADSLVKYVVPPEFRCVLDVGGGSGTWTVAFLRACPSGRAILFDLPAVVPLAATRFAAEGLSDRVTLAEGDFNRDRLPSGADLAWISAIAHQNSRAMNRELFRKVYAALDDGGRIAVRDLLMEPTRTAPTAGALFAVNMLVGTDAGGTYTLDEFSNDLEAAGFRDVTVVHREPTMNTILIARKR